MLGAQDPFADGQQGGELVAGPGRIPRLPGPGGEVAAGRQGVRVLGAQDPFADGQQGGELVPGPGRIPRLPGPDGEFMADDQGVGVLGAQDPLVDGQQGGELVAGPGRIPRPPGPAGEVAAGGQGLGVLGPVGRILCVRVGDLPGQVPGGRIAAAKPEVSRDLPHAAAGQVQDGPGVRQQHRAHRPRRGQFRVGGNRQLHQGRGGMFPLASLLRGELGAGDGLHHAVHQHQAVPGRSDQGVAAQRGHRIPRRDRITQQLPDLGRHLRIQQARGLFIGEQQVQRDRLRGQERQQPHQARRGRGIFCQPGQGQPQRGGHIRRMPGGLAAGQQVGLPGPEQWQVPGQGGPGGLHVRGGLLQGQRQPAQPVGELPGRRPVRVTGPVHQEIRRHLHVENRDVQRLARRPVLILGGDQHPPGPGGRHERLHRRPVRRVVEHHQPPGLLPGQHRMHRRHRIARVNHLPRPQLGGQHAELRRQHRRVHGRELPAHPHLAQVPVRVLDGHAGLPSAAQPAQHRHPRPRPPRPARQPGVQLRKQPLTARQEHRPRHQPHRQAGHLRPPLQLHRADSYPAPVGSHRPGSETPPAGCGYCGAEPGGVGFGGVTFP